MSLSISPLLITNLPQMGLDNNKKDIPELRDSKAVGSPASPKFPASKEALSNQAIVTILDTLSLPPLSTDTKKNFIAIPLKNANGTSLHENLSPSPKSKIDLKIEDLFISVCSLEEKYDEYTAQNKGYKNFFQNGILDKGKYLSDNKKNILDGIKLLAPLHYSAAKAILNDADKNYKNADLLVPCLIQFSHWLTIKDSQRKLENYQKKYKELKKALLNTDNSEFSFKKMVQVAIKIDHLHKVLSFNEKFSKEKGVDKFIGLSMRALYYPLYLLIDIKEKLANKIGKSVYFLFKNIWMIINVFKTFSLRKEWLFHLQPRIVNIYSQTPTTKEKESIVKRNKDHQKTFDSANLFWKSLETCKTIDEIKNKCKKAGIPHEFPPSIIEPNQLIKNPRFKRNIIQDFLYSKQKNLFMDKDKIGNLLSDKKIEQKAKIDRALPYILDQIKKCENLPYTRDINTDKNTKTIEEYFKEIHISIEKFELPAQSHVPNPPKSKLDWEKCVQNPDYCNALTKKWVEHQETVGMLAMQAMKQALSSKQQVEKKFLVFQAIQHVIGLISNAIQLVLCSPFTKLITPQSLGILFSDIYKLGIPGVGIFFFFNPLYPHLKFRIEALLMDLTKHLFSIFHKPNEYSAEAYLLTIKTEFYKCLLQVHEYSTLMKSAGLWIKANIKGIFKKNSKKGQDSSSSTDLTSKKPEKILKFVNKIKKFGNRLDELKLKDTQLILQPNLYKGKPKKFTAKNPFKELAIAVNNADVDYFSSDVKAFFELHLGFELKNEELPLEWLEKDKNKSELQKYSEDLFGESASTFFKTYDFNRFAYLKA